MKLVFATQNENKAKEIRLALPESIELLTLNDLNIQEEIPETSDTLEGNAELKALYVFQKFGLNCFADDTGLEVEALNNEPGVYSARYAGNERSDEKNMSLLLSNLEGNLSRSAQFRTAICLIINGEKITFEGIVTGEIGETPLGNEGFGYDPIFFPEHSKLSFAQMSMEEKNKLSHRSRALKKMLAYLNSI